MEFYRDNDLSQRDCRELILGEVLEYNENEMGRFLKCRALRGYKSKIVLNGYIRKYIEQKLGVIPVSGLTFVFIICERASLRVCEKINSKMRFKQKIHSCLNCNLIQLMVGINLFIHPL